MQETLQRNRLYWLLAALSILIVMVVWFMTNLVRLREPESASKIRMTVPSVTPESLVQMTSENTSSAYIDGVQNRNRQQANKAKHSGKSHVDRLVEGTPLLESQDSLDLAELKRQMQEVQVGQASLQELVRKLSAMRQIRSPSNRSTVAYYTAQTGVEHLSDAFRKSEFEAMAKAFEVISHHSLEQSVGVLTNTRTLKKGQPKNANTRTSNTRTSNKRTSEERRSDLRIAGRQDNTSPHPSHTEGDKSEIIPAHGALLQARLNLGLNTDIGGIATATIVGGRFHGTVVTASSYSAKRRHLAINFDRFCTAQGECGDIRAIAVDLQQGVAAIKGDYKGHYGIRFTGAVAASIIEGYGRSISSGLGNNAIFLDGRFISSQRQEVSSKQALKSSAYEAGNTVGQFFREFANRPPQVSKAINELIGLYIISPGVLHTGTPITPYPTDAEATNVQ